MMQHGDHDHSVEWDLDELDAEMSSSAREASMGFGTLLEMGATPPQTSFAEALRRRGRPDQRWVPPRY